MKPVPNYYGDPFKDQQNEFHNRLENKIKQMQMIKSSQRYNHGQTHNYEEDAEALRLPELKMAKSHQVKPPLHPPKQIIDNKGQCIEVQDQGFAFGFSKASTHFDNPSYYQSNPSLQFPPSPKGKRKQSDYDIMRQAAIDSIRTTLNNKISKSAMNVTSGLEINERTSEKTISTNCQTIQSQPKVNLPYLRPRKMTQNDCLAISESSLKSVSQNTNNHSSQRHSYQSQENMASIENKIKILEQLRSKNQSPQIPTSAKLAAENPRPLSTQDIRKSPEKFKEDFIVDTGKGADITLNQEQEKKSKKKINLLVQQKVNSMNKKEKQAISQMKRNLFRQQPSLGRMSILSFSDASPLNGVEQIDTFSQHNNKQNKSQRVELSKQEQTLPKQQLPKQETLVLQDKEENIDTPFVKEHVAAQESQPISQQKQDQDQGQKQDGSTAKELSPLTKIAMLNKVSSNMSKLIKLKKANHENIPSTKPDILEKLKINLRKQTESFTINKNSQTSSVTLIPKEKKLITLSTEQLKKYLGSKLQSSLALSGTQKKDTILKESQ